MTALTDPDHALRQIIETADVFEAGGGTWLLAPVTTEMADTLAAFEAEAEDRENDLCDEAQADDEPSFGSGTDGEQELDEADREDEGDGEPDAHWMRGRFVKDPDRKPASNRRSGGWIEVANLKRQFGIRRAVKYW